MMKASELPKVFKQVQKQDSTLVIEHYYSGAHHPTVIYVKDVVIGYYYKDDEPNETVVVYSDDPTQTVEYKLDEEVDVYAIKRIKLD